MKTIYMETTKISVPKTIGEIQGLLAEAGAQKIMIDYSDNEPVSIVFGMEVDGVLLSFKLPTRIDNLFNHLKSKRKKYDNETDLKDLDQARMIGWRQVLKWIQAQLALINIGMVKTEEVFLPYLFDGKKTVFEIFQDNGFKQIGYKGK